MFLHEAKQILRKFLLLRPRSPDNSQKVFPRSNFRDNSVQVLSLMHSNVQLLYLLLFFCRRCRRRSPSCLRSLIVDLQSFTFQCGLVLLINLKRREKTKFNILKSQLVSCYK